MNTFQKFSDPAQADALKELLESNGIPATIENERKYFDASFAGNTFESNIRVLVSQENFERAYAVLRDYYRHDLDHPDPEYYLFYLSLQELSDIVAQPDQWSYYDYLLAQRILATRGKEITSRQAEELKQERLETLAKPTRQSIYWIGIGYAAAIASVVGTLVYNPMNGNLGTVKPPMLGVFALLLGWATATGRKTLFDGRSVPTYTDSQRRHGRIIQIIAAAGIALFFVSVFLSTMR